jgi:hypothetical protein
VKSRRPLGNAEPGGDFFVAQTFGHQLQHFFFTRHTDQLIGPGGGFSTVELLDRCARLL